MNNYKITISYDGSAFNGWQRQNNTNNTIQFVLESTISRRLNEEIELNASGRTDAGVSAFGQMANFKCLSSIKESFVSDINKELSDCIRIENICLENENFHSRFDAISKTYIYYIDTNERPSVFKRKYVYHYPAKLDIELMRKAARILIGKNDYRAFSSEKSLEKDTIRTIYEIKIIEDKGKINISYTGSGFLYNMVRILTGTLIEVGEGKRSICSIEAAIQNKERANAGFMAPPCGLFLLEVNY